MNATPFCTLSIRRNLAPATQWHWAVELPNGHLYSCASPAAGSLPEVMADAAVNGVAALIRAENDLAQKDPAFAKTIGRKDTQPQPAQPGGTAP